MATGAIVAVVVVVGVIVGINLSGGGTKTNTSAVTVDGHTLDRLNSSVSLQEMRTAADNYSLTAHNGVYGHYPEVTSDPPIAGAGKPTLLYIGAEFCPYCATERWPLVLALSKFGTFENLSAIHSSATDIFPSTATFSFYKSSYTSPYLTFTSKEVATEIESQSLQKLTSEQGKLLDTYGTGGYPFVYLDGKAVIPEVEYDPQLLAGKTFGEVADEIEAGTSPLASSVTADAGVITSMICRMTGGRPGSVCRLFPRPITS